MRNKKIRPVKLYLFLIIAPILTIPLIIYFFDGSLKSFIAILLESLFIVVGFPNFANYIEVKNETIEIKHGVFSSNSKYNSFHKKNSHYD